MRTHAPRPIRSLLGSVLASALATGVAAPAAHADELPAGATAADLLPLAPSPVRLRSEHVVLTALDRSDEWRIEARYVLSNPGAEDARLALGFAELRAAAAGAAGAGAFTELSTRVEGAPVPTRRERLPEPLAARFGGVLWAFDVIVPAGRELHVEQRYRLAAGSDLAGNRALAYLTRPAGAWPAPLEHFTLSALLPAYARAVRDVVAPGLAVSPPRLDPNASAPRVELQLEARDWSPAERLQLEYNASSLMTLQPIAAGRSSDDPELFPWDHCAPNDPGADPQGCLNEVYAARGYPFKNPSVARQYYSGDPKFRLLPASAGAPGLWVRDASPLPAFADAWLDATDQARIQLWTARAAERRNGNAALPAPVAAAPAPVGLPRAPGEAPPSPLASAAAPAAEPDAPQVVVQQLSPARAAAAPAAAPVPAAPEQRAARCGLGPASSGTRASWLALLALASAWAQRRRGGASAWRA